MPLHSSDIESIAKEPSTPAGRIRRNILTDQGVTEKSGSFLSFVLFAAEVLFEIWIALKRHSPDFGLIAGWEREDLTGDLQDALQVLHDMLDDPSYNYVIHSHFWQHLIVPYLRWYLQIRLRLTLPTGFEAGSGTSVNLSLPEQHTEMLRARNEWRHGSKD
jgi:UDPglucose--hexose-1-phosphate uridylyltransferase